MEVVRAFNSELSSLYESRPPVSRAKMASVTKMAIKAIKFYKHVVQSVEKFILKCKPEYKVPGLYVIDSVVRQSRHQFGEKDVFGPRFTKNIVTTFQSLLKCPPDEKGRVVRVLNLWQKNGVFPVEVIQSLLDMAADPKNMECVLAAQRAVEKVVLAHQRSQGKATNGGTEESLLAQQNDIVNTVTKLLQQTEEGSLLASGQEVQLQQLQQLQQQLIMHTEMMSSKSQQSTPLIDNNLLAQIKLLTDQLLSKTDAPASGSAPPQPPVSSQNAAELREGGREHQNMEGVYGADISQHLGEVGAESRGREFQNMLHGEKGSGSRDLKRPAEPGFNKKLLDFDYGESDEEEEKKDPGGTQQQLPGGVHKLLNDPSLAQHIHNVSSLKSEQLRPELSSSDSVRQHRLEQQQEQFNKEIQQNRYTTYNEFPDVILVENPEVIEAMDKENDRDRRGAGRSRDRSRSPRRRGRSRSRSRERRRSRDRNRRSRSREHEREREREKERERKKKGLPPIKGKYISVCSTTLWFGHLAKYTAEEELRAEIEKYGTTESIKMVPPRGCAFVTMMYRKEAAKALDRMKGFKLNSSALRVAWAPNIGTKESQFKDMWDMDLGVTYIPWERLPANLCPLLNGAMIDEDSLPQHLKGKGLGQEGRSKQEKSAPAEEVPQSSTPSTNHLVSFGTPSQSVPSSQPMHMLTPQMMMTPQGQMPPTMQMPPANLTQLPLPGQVMPALNNGTPQGLPPNLLQPPPGATGTPISLPAGMTLSQMVSAAASLLGVPHNLPNSSVPSIAMETPLPRMPGMDTSSPMMPGQQPGLTARPALPPGSPFALPNLRPALPLVNQGLRLPFPMEEPKEWPSDDKLEEEALAEMEDDDIDQRTALPGPNQAHAPVMPLQLMRMGVPNPGGPRLPIQMPGGAPHPGMMMEIRQPVSSPGMAVISGASFGRPGMLGPRLVSPAGPPEGSDGMLRPPETLIQPAEGMMRPAESMMRPAEGMMRPAEGMMQPVEGMVRPSEGILVPAEGILQPGERMLRPREGMVPPPEGILHPAEGLVHPPEGFIRPPEAMIRPPEAVIRPPEGMIRPPEGMIRPGEGMMRPGEGLIRPGEGLIRPPEGMLRPPEGMIRPIEGMIRPPEGMLRPPEGMLRPPEGMLRPPEGMLRPPEGMIRPPEGMLRPPEGMIRPVEGMLRPPEGMIRPVGGMLRPGEGMLRPPEGMIRAQLPQGLQGPMGMQLRMSGQGPPGMNPGNLTLGPRLGLPGSPGMRPPIRFVLGQRPNLVRPGGPFGVENPRLQLGDLPGGQAGRNMLDEGSPVSLPNRNNGPQGPRPLPNLMIRASLAEGRPGLLGPRPNLPVGRGIRLGPGAMNLRGLRPEFLQGPGLDKLAFQRLPTVFSGGGHEGKSPAFREGGGGSPELRTVSEETQSSKTQDMDLRGDMDLRSDTDFRTDTDLRPKDLDLRKTGGSEGGEGVSEPSAPSTNYPPDSPDDSKGTFASSDQTKQAGEGAAKG